jgi:hypothetical protein
MQLDFHLATLPVHVGLLISCKLSFCNKIFYCKVRLVKISMTRSTPHAELLYCPGKHVVHPDCIPLLLIIHRFHVKAWF